MTLTEVLASPLLLPKDTVRLTTGNYVGTYTAGRSGDASDYVNIQPYDTGAVIVGRLNLEGAYLRLRDGLEICKLEYTPRKTSDGACDETTWLDVDDSGNVIISGAHIHDTSYGIVCKGNNIEINGCVFRAIGWDEESFLAGHLIYCTNRFPGTKMTIKACIGCDNFGFGLHGFSDGYDLHGADVNENIFFNAGTLSTWGGRRTNIALGCIGAAWVRDGVVSNNCTYFPDFTGGVGIQVGIGFGGSTGMVIKDNVIVGGIYSLYVRNPTNPTITGNVIIGPTYYSKASDPNDAQTEVVYDMREIFPDNTYLDDFPTTGSIVKVFPLDYNANRAHVAVYNWALADNVEIDLSDVIGISVGDSVTVTNAQDLKNDIQTLVVGAGKKITVDMQAANRTVAAPVNWTAPATTFPRFGAFVVERV